GQDAATDDPIGEVVTLTDTHVLAQSTELVFSGLKHTYRPDSVTINANVALATHGETKHEVLGGSDASQAYQRFNLRQPPLTYTSSPLAAGGAQSTLQVRVNQVLWHEVPTLYGHRPREHVYLTRIDDDGKTRVQFGDGWTG